MSTVNRSVLWETDDNNDRHLANWMRIDTEQFVWYPVTPVLATALSNWYYMFSVSKLRSVISRS